MSKLELDLEYLKVEDTDEGIVDKLSYVQENLQDILHYFNNRKELDVFFDLMHDLLQEKKCKAIEYQAMLKILKTKDSDICTYKSKVDNLEFDLKRSEETLFKFEQGKEFAENRVTYFTIMTQVLHRLSPYSYDQYYLEGDASRGLDLEKISLNLDSILANFMSDLSREDADKLEYFDTRNQILEIVEDRDFRSDYAFLKSIRDIIAQKLVDLSKLAVSEKFRTQIEFWESKKKKDLLKDRDEMIEELDEALGIESDEPYEALTAKEVKDEIKYTVSELLDQLVKE